MGLNGSERISSWSPMVNSASLPILRKGSRRPRKSMAYASTASWSRTATTAHTECHPCAAFASRYMFSRTGRMCVGYRLSIPRNKYLISDAPKRSVRLTPKSPPRIERNNPCPTTTTAAITRAPLEIPPAVVAATAHASKLTAERSVQGATQWPLFVYTSCGVQNGYQSLTGARDYVDPSGRLLP